MSANEKAYDEIVDLFARGTTSEQIVLFRPSPQSQARATILMERLKSGEITEAESAELDRLGELEHLMQLVKARARAFQAQ